ncbi:hypothetical protein HGRIS_013711 [Hohenbuehelia grisea]|uniref:Polyadenylation factor subunit 2 n=1 Tax=Hohenbuehelia grisea TaxID=104357 RepID=A0ABR3IWB8_9AGAR
MSTALPLLLPPQALPPKHKVAHTEWKPQKYLTEPQPPPLDDMKIQEQELLNSRQPIDGKLIKKTKPRRTVDFNGGMGRWMLMRKLRPSPGYVPYMRPGPSHIIDLFPPKAYPDNASTSLLTKFVHTSTNKIRCPVNVVTWTPEGRRVLTGSTSGEFTLWNGLTFNFETILQAHDTGVCAMSFTHSGAYLASTDKSGIIKYFEPNMNNLTAWQGSRSREPIRGLSFSPDDRRFATASDDSTIKIWSFEESREESNLTGHGWDVKCVQWHATKGLLVSGSKDNSVKFWDPRTGTVLSTIHQHKNTVQALAWSPNGDQVASASRDQTVRVFDIRAMKEFRVLKGHKKEVCSVAWHPVHPVLVSGGSEGSILHWDVSSAESTFLQPPTSARATLSQAHDSNVWALAYHPLGHLLVSASNDHTTRFWSRERPGDTSASFTAGGEKPPEVAPDAGGQDDDDEAMPGFAYGAAWWGKEENQGTGNPSGTGAAAGAPSGGSDTQFPGFGYSQNTSNGALPGFGSGAGAEGASGDGGYMKRDPYVDNDDFLPGFSSQPESSSFGGRQDRPPPPPSHGDMYGNGGGHGAGRGGHGGEDWGRGGGDDWAGRTNPRQGRWGPRRGRY